ncbi:unnamed protein product [Rhizoctonia solani]|uniref:DUF1996 domain-containing protein n=1 Tax=Rhizoctonia solani TaxID=456999 RepID=A0A8H3GKM0_9AGAM|nr:unnamed protein product [Rhizoctonia solani]
MLTSLSRAIIAGALLAGSAKAGDHFIMTQIRELSYTRVDPLRTPGTVGPHVHNVVGGSMFSPDSTTPEILQQSKCSSNMVQDDKSAYWSPLLYYNHGNGSYSPMISSTRIYYFLKPGNGTTPVKAFPKGFRMLGGGYSDSRPQTFPPRGELSYDQKQALDPRINAIMWGCSAGAVQGQGDGGSLPGQRPYLPNDAPNGCGVVNAGMFFPSCGDGRLDSDDHFSHMSYPLDDSNGYNCPPSHPIKYPTIFMEHFYFPSADQPYRGANNDNWILSNGDPTGLNMHGDFINGWNQDTLEQTMSQCNTPNAPEDNLQACAPLAKSLNVDTANTCLSEGNIAEEDVGLSAPITGFPGCNPYWGWESRTKATCAASSDVALVQPSGRYTVDEFKVNLPIANGTSKTVTGPAVGNATNYYSDYYGSSSSYASTVTASYLVSTTSSSSYPASTSTSASPSVTETGSSSEAAPTGVTKSEDPASTTVSESSSVSASSTVSAAVASSTSSASYDYEYPASPSETQSSGSAQTTSNNAAVQETSSTAAAQTTSTGVPAQAGSSASSTSSSSTTSPANAAATPQSPNSHVSSVSSSSTSAAGAAPTPQNANVNPGKNHSGRPKTCRPKKTKAASTHKARRHRELQNRLIH